MKTCTKCKVRQSIDNFYRRGISVQSWCKTCFSKDSRDYQKRDPVRARKFWLKHRYGITPEREVEILISQEYLCAICKCELERAKPHIDHDKDTGIVRGILCSLCNQGFGLFAENIDYLLSAIAYKKKWSTET